MINVNYSLNEIVNTRHTDQWQCSTMTDDSAMSRTMLGIAIAVGISTMRATSLMRWFLHVVVYSLPPISRWCHSVGNRYNVYLYTYKYIYIIYYIYIYIYIYYIYIFMLCIGVAVGVDYTVSKDMYKERYNTYAKSCN